MMTETVKAVHYTDAKPSKNSNCHFSDDPVEQRSQVESSMTEGEINIYEEQLKETTLKKAKQTGSYNLIDVDVYEDEHVDTSGEDKQETQPSPDEMRKHLIRDDNNGKKCLYPSIVQCKESIDANITVEDEKGVQITLGSDSTYLIVQQMGNWKVKAVDQSENTLKFANQWLRSSIEVTLSKDEMESFVKSNSFEEHQCDTDNPKCLILNLSPEAWAAYRSQTDESLNDLQKMQIEEGVRLLERMFSQKFKAKFKASRAQQLQQEISECQAVMRTNSDRINTTENEITIEEFHERGDTRPEPKEEQQKNERIKVPISLKEPQRDKVTDKVAKKGKEEEKLKNAQKDKAPHEIAKKSKEEEKLENALKLQVKEARIRLRIRLNNFNKVKEKKIPKRARKRREMQFDLLKKWYPMQIDSLGEQTKHTLLVNMEEIFKMIMNEPYADTLIFEKMLLYLFGGGSFNYRLLKHHINEPYYWDIYSYLMDIVYAVTNTEPDRIMFYRELESLLQTISDQNKHTFIINLRRIQSNQKFNYDDMKEILSYISGLTENQKKTHIKRFIDVDEVDKDLTDLKISWLEKTHGFKKEEGYNKDFYEIVASCKWSKTMMHMFMKFILKNKVDTTKALEFLEFAKSLPSMIEVEGLIYKEFSTFSITDEASEYLARMQNKLVLEILVTEVQYLLDDEADIYRFRFELSALLESRNTDIKCLIRCLTLARDLNGIDKEQDAKMVLADVLDTLEVFNNFKPEQSFLRSELKRILNRTFNSNSKRDFHKSVIANAFQQGKQTTYSKVSQSVFESLDTKYWTVSTGAKMSIHSSKSILESCKNIDAKMRYYCNNHVFFSEDFKEKIPEEIERIETITNNIKKVESRIAIIGAAVLYNYSFYPRVTQLVALLMIAVRSDTRGILAEMKTGEGKSMLIRMLAVYYALQGLKVDVVTTSKPLVEQEKKVANEKFFKLFGLEMKDNISPESDLKRQAAYKAGILYGTSEMFEADFLRDKFFGDPIRSERPFGVAIIDEVDNMLYDQRTSTVRLSSVTPMMDELLKPLALIWNYITAIIEAYEVGNKIIKKNDLISIHQMALDYFTGVFDNNSKLDEDSSTLSLGVPQHLKEFCNSQLKVWIHSAISAKLYFEADKHYKVDASGKIYPIDYKNTGVVMKNSVWENGLVQFIQMKEGVRVTPEMVSTNFISRSNFFAKYKIDKSLEDEQENYNQIIGLTGTLGGEATCSFFRNTYEMTFVSIPSYKSNSRIKYMERVYQYGEDWKAAICRSCILEASVGRAVLVIFQFVQQVHDISSILSRMIDQSMQIILYTESGNLKQRFESKESRVKCGDIILATNIAGRGTDLKTTDDVEKSGGLHVCVTFLPDNERVEEQNIGRTSRAGKKGSSQLIIYDAREVSVEKLKKQREDRQKQISQQATEDLESLKAKDNLFSAFCGYQAKYSRQAISDESGVGLLDELRIAYAPKHERLCANLRARYEAKLKDDMEEMKKSYDEQTKDLKSFKRWLETQEDHLEAFQEEYEKEVTKKEAQSRVKGWLTIFKFDSIVTNRVYKRLFQRRKQYISALCNKLVYCPKAFEDYKKEAIVGFKQQFLQVSHRKVSEDIAYAFIHDLELDTGAENNLRHSEETGLMKEYSLRALRERWGLWFKQVTKDEGILDIKKIHGLAKDKKGQNDLNFKIFKEKIEGKTVQQDQEETSSTSISAKSFIENPVYIIKKGNLLIRHSPYQAQKFYTTAIDMDKEYSLYAHYYRAIAICYSLLNKEYELKELEKAIKDLEFAKEIICEKYIPRILKLEAILLLSRREMKRYDTTVHHTHKVTILTKLYDNIVQNIQAINKVKDGKSRLVMQELSIHAYFYHTENVDSPAINEFAINGLEFLFMVNMDKWGANNLQTATSLISFTQIPTYLIMKETQIGQNVCPDMKQINYSIETVLNLFEEKNITSQISKKWGIRGAVEKSILQVFCILCDIAQKLNLSAEHEANKTNELEESIRSQISVRFMLLASEFRYEYMGPFQKCCSKYIKSVLKEIVLECISDIEILKKCFETQYNHYEFYGKMKKFINDTLKEGKRILHKVKNTLTGGKKVPERLNKKDLMNVWKITSGYQDFHEGTYVSEYLCQSFPELMNILLDRGINDENFNSVVDEVINLKDFKLELMKDFDAFNESSGSYAALIQKMDHDLLMRQKEREEAKLKLKWWKEEQLLQRSKLSATGDFGISYENTVYRNKSKQLNLGELKRIQDYREMGKQYPRRKDQLKSIETEDIKSEKSNFNVLLPDREDLQHNRDIVSSNAHRNVEKNDFTEERYNFRRPKLLDNIKRKIALQERLEKEWLLNEKTDADMMMKFLRKEQAAELSKFKNSDFGVDCGSGRQRNDEFRFCKVVDDVSFSDRELEANRHKCGFERSRKLPHERIIKKKELEQKPWKADQAKYRSEISAQGKMDVISMGDSHRNRMKQEALSNAKQIQEFGNGKGEYTQQTKLVDSKPPKIKVKTRPLSGLVSLNDACKGKEITARVYRNIEKRQNIESNYNLLRKPKKMESVEVNVTKRKLWRDKQPKEHSIAKMIDKLGACAESTPFRKKNRHDVTEMKKVNDCRGIDESSTKVTLKAQQSESIKKRSIREHFDILETGNIDLHENTERKPGRPFRQQEKKELGEKFEIRQRPIITNTQSRYELQQKLEQEWLLQREKEQKMITNFFKKKQVDEIDNVRKAESMIACSDVHSFRGNRKQQTLFNTLRKRNSTTMLDEKINTKLVNKKVTPKNNREFKKESNAKNQCSFDSYIQKTSLYEMDVKELADENFENDFAEKRHFISQNPYLNSKQRREAQRNQLEERWNLEQKQQLKFKADLIKRARASQLLELNEIGKFALNHRGTSYRNQRKQNEISNFKKIMSHGKNNIGSSTNVHEIQENSILGSISGKERTDVVVPSNIEPESRNIGNNEIEQASEENQVQKRIRNIEENLNRNNKVKTQEQNNPLTRKMRKRLEKQFKRIDKELESSKETFMRTTKLKMENNMAQELNIIKKRIERDLKNTKKTKNQKKKIVERAISTKKAQMKKEIENELIEINRRKNSEIKKERMLKKNEAEDKLRKNEENKLKKKRNSKKRMKRSEKNS